MKRFRYLSILAVFFLFNLATNAQSSWFAYFYNYQTAGLDYVTADGQILSLSLGLGENSLITEGDLVFANNRHELAYCQAASNVGQIPSQGATTLVIRDILNERNIHEIDLGLSDYCWAGIYNSNDTLIIVGIVRHTSADVQTANPEAPLWEILLIDTASAAIVDSINSNKAGAEIVIPYEGGDANDFFIPDAFAIEGANLLFAASYTHGAEMVYSYNMNSQEFQPYEHWGKFYNRFGSEAIWVTRLHDYPALPEFGPAETQNALMYADSSGEAKVLYYTADWSISQASFINGGQAIAMRLGNGQANLSKWIMIDREGNESELLASASFNEGNIYHYFQILPTLEGYGIYETISNSDSAQQNFRFSLLENGTETLIWEQSAANTNHVWSMVHSAETPYQVFSAFPEFDLSGIPTGQ